MDRLSASLLAPSSLLTLESVRNTLLFFLCCLLLAACSVESVKMKFEARVFFPLDQPAARGGEAAGATASAVPAGSTPASAAHFSLFDASDFRHFHPSASVPTFSAQEVEDRTDLYLLDPTLDHMESIGLKLRGTGSGSGSSTTDGSARGSYDVDLKVRKDVTVCSEQWKKVVRATPIQASFATLASDVLPPIRKAHEELDDKHKRKLGATVQRLQQQLEERAQQDSKHSFYVVEVRKRRSELKELKGEQTDVDVRLLWHGDDNEQSQQKQQRATLHFRSVCFEGDEQATQTPHIRGLFQHVQQRYGDSADATQAAFVGGYPDFLMRVLKLSNKPQEAADAQNNKTEL